MDGKDVVCPDCGQGTIEPGGACTVCQLSFEDLEAAAAFMLDYDDEVYVGLGELDGGAE